MTGKGGDREVFVGHVMREQVMKEISVTTWLEKEDTEKIKSFGINVIREEGDYKVF
jgi:hypothetical protein